MARFWKASLSSWRLGVVALLGLAIWWFHDTLGVVIPSLILIGIVLAWEADRRALHFFGVPRLAHRRLLSEPEDKEALANFFAKLVKRLASLTVTSFVAYHAELTRVVETFLPPLLKQSGRRGRSPVLKAVSSLTKEQLLAKFGRLDSDVSELVRKGLECDILKVYCAKKPWPEGKPQDHFGVLNGRHVIIQGSHVHTEDEHVPTDFDYVEDVPGDAAVLEARLAQIISESIALDAQTILAKLSPATGASQ